MGRRRLQRLPAAVAAAVLLASRASCSGNALGAATNGSLELPFAIGPAASRLSPAFRTAAVTWGMSVVKGDGDGLYHGYAAAMTNGCPLGAWTTNSEVVHTVSEVPTGPFRYKDTAIPAFAHNPRVARAPDGTYVLFTIGRPITKGQQCDCSPGGKPHRPAQRSTQVTFIHHATSPDGPWTALDPNGTLGLTNPTPHIFPNGSVVVVGLGNCSVAGSRSQGCAQVATAPTWRGPYTVDWRGQHGLGPWCANRGTWVFEDPFVWFSAKRGAWSMMVHQYNRSNAANQVLDGGYATSADESIYSNWTWGGHQQPLYTGLLTYADGSSDMMVRRERPSLLFSDEGEPSVLYTAVCPPGDHGGSYCYTVANPLTVKTDDELVLPETDWFASAQLPRETSSWHQQLPAPPTPAAADAPALQTRPAAGPGGKQSVPLKTGELEAAGSVAPTRLRIEYQRTPLLGLDVPSPRFSWSLSSDSRGATQSAYELQVSGGAVRWSSGRVDSNRSQNVAYLGPALPADTDCMFSVTAWGRGGEPSTLSSSFSTGIANAHWASARWVSMPGASTTSSFQVRKELPLAPVM